MLIEHKLYTLGETVYGGLFMKYRSKKFTAIIMLAAGLSVTACSPDSSKDSARREKAAAEAENYQPQGILAKSLPEIADALNKVK